MSAYITEQFKGWDSSLLGERTFRHAVGQTQLSDAGDSRSALQAAGPAAIDSTIAVSQQTQSSSAKRQQQPCAIECGWAR